MKHFAGAHANKGCTRPSRIGTVCSGQHLEAKSDIFGTARHVLLLGLPTGTARCGAEHVTQRIGVIAAAFHAARSILRPMRAKQSLKARCLAGVILG